jgi:hypothetical protein
MHILYGILVRAVCLLPVRTAGCQQVAEARPSMAPWYMYVFFMSECTHVCINTYMNSPIHICRYALMGCWGEPLLPLSVYPHGSNFVRIFRGHALHHMWKWSVDKNLCTGAKDVFWELDVPHETNKEVLGIIITAPVRHAPTYWWERSLSH